MHKAIIGVMGAGKDATEHEIQDAYEIGKIVAEAGAILLSGGMKTGVMEASCQGAHEAHGMTIGISPNDDKTTLNEFVDIPIITSMKSGRNYTNILSSDIVIGIGVMSPGTLSEIAFALALGKPVIILGTDPEMRAYIAKIAKSPLAFADTPEKARELLIRQMDNISGSVRDLANA